MRSVRVHCSESTLVRLDARTTPEWGQQEGLNKRRFSRDEKLQNHRRLSCVQCRRVQQTGPLRKRKKCTTKVFMYNIYIHVQYIRVEAVRKKTLMTGLRSGGNRNLTARRRAERVPLKRERALDRRNRLNWKRLYYYYIIYSIRTTIVGCCVGLPPCAYKTI